MAILIATGRQYVCKIRIYSKFTITVRIYAMKIVYCRLVLNKNIKNSPSLETKTVFKFTINHI